MARHGRSFPFRRSSRRQRGAGGVGFVQSNTSFTAGATDTATVALTGVASGNKIIISVSAGSNNRDVSSIVDNGSGSNTYVRVGAAKIVGAAYMLTMWESSGNVDTSEDLTFTVTMDSASAANITIHVAEYSAVSASTADANDYDGAETGTGITTGPVTPAANDSLIVSCHMSENAARPIVEPSGWNEREYQSSTAALQSLADITIDDGADTSAAWTVTGGNTAQAAVIGAWALTEAPGGLSIPIAMYHYIHRLMR